MNNNIIEDLTELSGFNLYFLSKFDDEKLNNLCQLNNKINSYCNNDRLWDFKIDTIFPDFPILRSYNNNKKILYFILKKLNLEDIVRFSLDMCNIEILDWIMKQSDNLGKKFGSFFISIKFDNCIGKGHKNFEQFAIKNGIPLNYTKIANNATYHKNFSLLEELANDDIYPEDIALEEAMIYGHLDAVEWLYKYVPDIFDDKLILDCLHIVCKEGHINILIFFGDLDYYPDISCANQAAKYGQIQILDWLYKHNIYPDLNGRDKAILNLQDISLDWMFIKLGYSRKNDNIIVDPIKLINDSIIYNQYKDTKRLFSMGYRPDEKVIDLAVEEEAIEALNFLAENNIYPTKTAVNEAAINGNYKMLEWFLRRNIYPTI